MPGPSGPLYPANRFLTHGHFSVIFCHPKSFLKHVPRITVGEGSVGFPPNGCVARRPLRAGGKRSCPSRHPRGWTHRQVALPGPLQVRGARKVHEWESHGPSAEGPGVQSLSAIPGLAGSTQGARPHNRAPSPARRARCGERTGCVRPSSPWPWTNPRPREATALRTSGPQLPIGGGAVPATRRGPGVVGAVSPAPKKGNRRAYSPWSFSRFAQGAHGRSRAPRATSPSAAGLARRGAAHRRRHRRRRLPSSSAPGLLVRAAHLPLSELGEPDRGAPQHKLCVSAPPRPPPCARAHTLPHHHLTSADGYRPRKCVALFSSSPKPALATP